MGEHETEIVATSPPGQRPASASVIERLVGAAAVDVSLLRTHRDFRLLSIGQLVSGFGNSLTERAFPSARTSARNVG
jgi:hypothetical protein